MLKRLLIIIPSIGILVLAIVFILVNRRQETIQLTDEVKNQAPGEFVKLSMGSVHFQLQGPDTAQLIIFIHGGGTVGQEVWQNTLPYFKDKGYQILSFDLYNRGYSDRVNVENTPELLFQQVSELLVALHLNNKPAHVVCMSMGAIIALDYIAANPDKVDKLIMLDPIASGNFSPNPLFKVPIIADFLMTLYWYPRAIEVQRKEFVSMQQFAPYAKRINHFMKFEGYKRATRSTWLYMLNIDKRPILKQVPKNKVLLLYGSKDPYFSSVAASSYHAYYPTMQTSMINDAGHLPHFEKSKEVNEAIFNFLKTD